MSIPIRRKGLRLDRKKQPLILRPEVACYRSGRLALYSLLSSLKAHSKRREVLLPAYLCRSIVIPCEWNGLSIRYYNVTETLSPDWTSFEEQISHNTLAVLVIHYFGFPNQASRAAQICKNYRAILVEDGAHVDLVSGASKGSIAVYGDWIIGSMRKFYPLYDGAVLFPIDASPNLLAQAASKTSIGAEARSLKHLLERFRAGRTDTVVSDCHKEGGSDRVETGSDNSGYRDCRFEVSDHIGMTKVSRTMFQLFATDECADARIKNYTELLDFSESLSRARALYLEMPPDVVPYVFPLLLNNPNQDHKRLREKGVEVWRWEDIVTDRCRVSYRFSRSLVQVPCHQGLSFGQMCHLKNVLGEVLA